MLMGRLIAESVLQKLFPPCHGNIMVTDAHVFWINGTQNMHLVSTRYSHPFKVHTGAQKDAVIYDRYLSNTCELWDEPSPRCVITINNANNTPTILCNSLYIVVI